MKFRKRSSWWSSSSSRWFDDLRAELNITSAATTVYEGQLTFKPLHVSAGLKPLKKAHKWVGHAIHCPPQGRVLYTEGVHPSVLRSDSVMCHLVHKRSELVTSCRWRIIPHINPDQCWMRELEKQPVCSRESHISRRIRSVKSFRPLARGVHVKTTLKFQDGPFVFNV